ncbi:hypothetical protein [uncultured Duncaniella sp.]|nr:hypothetical protein [uncultured Duncaniella sp.]
MLNKLTILFTLALVGCTAASDHKEASAPPSADVASVESLSLPEGFTIVEKQPQGYFVRVASSERASVSTIQTIATSLDGKFDRIDLCTFAAHERGDEYASIIDGKLYDYVNDKITTIK